MRDDSARLKMILKRDVGMHDPRRPVWLEATDSFYKKLNRTARECHLSRYEALSRGLDALLRENEVRNSALNRNIKSPAQSEVFRRTMGQVSRNYWSTISTEEKRREGGGVRKPAGIVIARADHKSDHQWTSPPKGGRRLRRALGLRRSTRSWRCDRECVLYRLSTRPRVAE